MTHSTTTADNRTGFEIAVIGMAGRFPGARNLDEFWNNLSQGVESISFFSDDEVLSSGVGHDVLRDPNYVRAAGRLEDYDLFDAAFFGYTPREAELMDPQQRIFLECAWEAMEHAAYDGKQYGGSIGVYAGSSTNTYRLANLHSNPNLAKIASGPQIKLGSDSDFLTTRTSYKLDLKGPSVVVQSACSTSLVAVHLACQGLLSGECDIALAGGVSVSVPQTVGYLYQVDGILSPDGHCRAFDAKAQGTVSGSGAGIVVLKRLEDALADGDTIHAVLMGSAVNNDGSAKIGYTAPSVDGEAGAVRAAMAMADVHPESISYIETHGTGTKLGDPIEIAALTQAFRAKTDKTRYCALGALKTNIGHLDAAAGVASLIKTILAAKHKRLPPTLHFESPNPELDLEASPFFVNTRLTDWKSEQGPLRAGVSSFGFGGTNAHVVLEEAPPAADASPSRPWQLLLLSARTEDALSAATDRLSTHIKGSSKACLADIAYTLQVGRQAFRHRQMLVCRDAEDAASTLEQRYPARVLKRVHEEGFRPVGFMFTGQGAQHANMGREIYESEPFFRERVDHCVRLLEPILGWNLLDLLYPQPQDGRVQQTDERLKQTGSAQPAIFVLEYALAQLWIKWGVRPQAMIGHSIGEFVAACLSGVFSLEDALALVAERGRLMQQLEPGAMLTISLPESEVAALLGPHLSLAAVNGVSLSVVSGPTDAIQQLEQQLAVEKITHRRLHTSHAFHSEMMEPILEPFRQRVASIKLHPPQLPYVSNVTGTWIRESEATDPGYWAHQLRHTVRFADGVGALLKESRQILLEVGPGPTLKTLAMQHPMRSSDQVIASSLPHPQERASEAETLLRSLGQLWLSGIRVDWSSFYAHETRRRLPLPTYPFERKRYWIEPRRGPAKPDRAEEHELRKDDLSDSFYIPSWKRTKLPRKWNAAPRLDSAASRWLLFAHNDNLTARLTEELDRAGADVVVVKTGEKFSVVNDHTVTVNPGDREDYERLVDVLLGANRIPNHVVHAWALRSNCEPGEKRDAAELGQESCHDLNFFSLLYLAQAFGKHHVSDQIRITTLANNLQEISGDEVVRPQTAMVLGPCQVIPREYPHLACRVVDIVWPTCNERETRRLVERLLAELTDGHRLDSNVSVAYRGNHRLVQDYEPIQLTRTVPGATGFPQNGVCLITGGLGGMGLALATHLAVEAQAKLILVGSTPLPPVDEWDHWLHDHGSMDSVSRKVQEVRRLQQRGAEVLAYGADVSKLHEMQSVLADARHHWGPIHGVIHAAGVPDGALIQRRRRDISEAVLAPKVTGTLILDRLLRDDPLEFFVLCSSLSSVLGPPGQVAYCAANAFLDAFAYDRTRRVGQLTTSINWDTWKEVGMAVRAIDEATQAKLDRSHSAEADGTSAAHVLFDRQLVDETKREVFTSSFDLRSHWLLDEHRIEDVGVLPGTAYLEMARAAVAHHAPGLDVHLRELYLLQPLTVGEHEVREVHTSLRKNKDAFEFEVASRVGPDRGWQAHATGTIELADPHSVPSLDLAELKSTLGQGAAPQPSHSGVLHVGPRWENLKEVRLRGNEGLALLELPDEYASDLKSFVLHPALLDIATAYVLGRGEQHQAKYLPFSFKGVHIRAPLPQRFFSYAKLLGDDASAETVRIQVQLIDEQGRELLRINEYTLRQADYGRAMQTPAISTEPSGRQPTRAISDLLEHGLSSAEGLEVFERCVASRLPQVLVSTRSIASRLRSVGGQSDPEVQVVADEESQQAAHPRPDLATDYIPPKNETETILSTIWQQLLGIQQVGISDDFFELGGHSLLALQVISRVREEFQVELPMGSLFEEPTVAGLAGRIDTIRWAAEDRSATDATSATDREEFEV